MPRLIALLFATLLGLLLAAGSALHAQVPPDERYRSFETPHFHVHYAEGLEPLARRAAARAEQAYAALAADFLAAPPGRVELVIVNASDRVNGFVSFFPRTRVVIHTQPPTSSESLNFFDDWLELVLTHELAHVFHLEHAGGVWGALRRVFGRTPLAFPQFLAPQWVLEGLATHYESRLTDAGRIRGSYHEMVLRMAALEDSFFSLDRASGDPLRWPAGATRYVYGGHFLQYLAERHGPDATAEWVHRIGRQVVPYRVDAAARAAYGTAFSTAWRDWRDSLRTHAHAVADSLRAAGLTEPEWLTSGSRIAAFPRYSRSGDTLAFSFADGRERPAIRLLLPSGEPRALAATALDPRASWLPDGDLLVAQLDLVDPYRVYSDAYRVGAAGGERRLTRGARVWDLDAHPRAPLAVGVGDAGGSNVLVRYDLTTGELRRLTAPTPDEAWSLPRWSPDGGRIAAARWRRGGFFDVVVLDSAGAVLRELTRDRAVDDAPAWSPDGRYVLFSSDRTGIANLYAYDLQGERLLQVTNVLGGAFQPDVSPDGRWIVFADYAADGYHVARIAFDPASWRPAPPVRAALRAPAASHGSPASAPPGRTLHSAAPPADSAGGPARRYTPWRSLSPTAWSPVLVAGDTALGTALGASIWGRDVVERHRYFASAAVHSDELRLTGAASYGYAGLGQPVLGLSLSQSWDADAALLRQGESVRAVTLLERERQAAATVGWSWPRYRSYRFFNGGLTLSGERVEFASDSLQRLLGDSLRQRPREVGLFLNAGVSTARGYTLSISREQGAWLSGTLTARRYTEPLPGREDASGYLRGVLRGRTYRGLGTPGFARSVLALRLDAGAERGSVSPGIEVGGTSGAVLDALAGVGGLGGSAAFPVRGYPSGAQEGTRAFTANAEYRFPLAWVERGAGVLPVFLRRAWGDVFADAGAAWCDGRGCGRAFLRDQPTRPQPLYSVGAELGTEFVVGYGLPLPLRLGLALPLRRTWDGGRVGGGPAAYLQLGWAF